MLRSPLALVVSLHDAHPGSLLQVGQQRHLLEGWGVHRCSILVVPEFHHGSAMSSSAEFVEWAEAWQSIGDELVLHGYYHDRRGQRTTMGNFWSTRVYTNHEAEFLDLPEVEARQRLAAGLEQFAALGWKPAGFIAPCWLMSRQLPTWLWDMGFGYTNTISQIWTARGAKIPARSLCWSTRTGWRTALSLGWNAWLASVLSGKPILRLSLHPNDFSVPAVQRQVERMVKTALQAGYDSTTYAEYVSAR